MIVLVTGHRGRLGAAIADALTSGGYEVRGFDLADGGDVLDSEAVRRAAQGVTSIVHIAGIAGDRPARPADIMAVNLLGTWNVLLAAEAAGIGRVVYFSSGKALGMLERDPDYLPIDDAHRGLPSLPYALSKWLAEEMCAAFTARSGIDTLCLRPVQAFDERSYAIAMADLHGRPVRRAAGPWVYTLTSATSLLARGRRSNARRGGIIGCCWRVLTSHPASRRWNWWPPFCPLFPGAVARNTCATRIARWWIALVPGRFWDGPRAMPGPAALQT